MPRTSSAFRLTRPRLGGVFVHILGTAACLVLGANFGRADEAKNEDAPSPVLRFAKEEFAGMKSTVYQHKTQVDAKTGDYRYDCVGFVSHALRHAAPQAWASTTKTLGLAKGHIPSPGGYRRFFSGLATQPQPGWEMVAKVADLRPGDVVAWEYKTERSSGHAAIIGSTPVKGSDGSWTVEVYDSTSARHAEDSRPNDPRTETLEATGRKSGLGHGTMALLENPATGALAGYRWSPKAKGVLVPIAAGRPKS